MYFSSSYAEARGRFLRASRDGRAHIQSYVHPTQVGPQGEELAVDLALFGNRHAKRIMIVISGTHGVEAFAGSAAQAALMHNNIGQNLPTNTALLLVHSLNPYGFAYLRRVNEDNVDVNRNFLEQWCQELDSPYGHLHPLLTPRHWLGPEREQADSELLRLALTQGARTLQAAITLGQWSHPNGIFYGGTKPVWSNLVWRQIMESYVGEREAVALIDIHTGLGDYAVAEVIFRARFDNNGYARARRWYGDGITSSEDDTSSSTKIAGNIHSALDRETRSARLTSVTLEFGTLGPHDVLNALRADNWLHVYGNKDHPLAGGIKCAIQNAFCCDNDNWKSLIINQSLEIVARGLCGLAR